MAKFKVGDRVRFVGDEYISGPAPQGLRGTVEYDSGHKGSSRYDVQFDGFGLGHSGYDGSMDYWWCTKRELEFADDVPAERKFKVGDRVRDFEGDVGQVIADDGDEEDNAPYCVELLDSYTVYYDADDLEHVAPPAYKVGDAVVIANRAIFRSEVEVGDPAIVEANDNGHLRLLVATEHGRIQQWTDMPARNIRPYAA